MKLIHSYNSYIQCNVCAKLLDISQYSNTSLRKFGYFNPQNSKLVKRNLRDNRIKITCKNCTAKPREYIVCSICNTKKLINCFSKNQRKRVPFVKCLQCSEEIAQFNPNELINILNSMGENMIIDDARSSVNESGSSESSTFNSLHQNEPLSTSNVRLSKEIAPISPSTSQLSQESSTHKEANLCKKFQKLTLKELLAIDKYNID
ncbi:hypothetical protein CONCODRAFT_70062 [Conidiobolus coronatus NRRL 28638]|uniref:Stc1 domain-containing protein n=1 Tax=Conidiobolus coronatus (strain ATCC 28846 / CBS 209.66 / NRRL 28638) TaxID=796925 RepID=A0A137P851_CONC2|nr:hypothetical protein CONCODRAFT_70062 [Conidiobolus coronatus NRRL 28638]|eukprot:KXN71162.1 hypothetical protein CONCODRAFT_70062 [Conidiobolus coronatus NRRL 28638]